ncbi:MAG: DUF4870 domain-containing protein [Candidatus Paceibacterota bacterium]
MEPNQNEQVPPVSPQGSVGGSSFTPPPSPQGNIGGNTGLAIVAYLWILVIVPLVANKDNDPFVKFHAKQGLILLIAWVIVSVFNSMLWRMTFSSFGIGSLLNLGCFILMIFGIINASSRQMKELPLIGHLASKFTF